MGGAAMASPVSPIVAKLCGEDLKNKAIGTTESPPSLWKRYVDDIFVIQDIEHNDQFLQHVNSTDKAIKFTVENTRPDQAMSFMDTIITPTPKGTLSTGVYRKPISTDQYLQRKATIT